MTAVNPYLLLVNDTTSRGTIHSRNMVFYSELKNREINNAFRGPGLKYVISGAEYYIVRGKQYKVSEKQFLVNDNIPGTVGVVDSKKPVKGICIDIDTRIISDVFAVLNKSWSIDPGNPPEPGDELPFFFEHIADASLSVMGKRLALLENHLLRGDFALPFLNEEWFLETAGELITQQHPKWQGANQLDFRKNSTRKEIMQRLLRGLDYMQSNFRNNPDIKTIAGACNLSEFRFFRAFKAAFRITPYQYMLNCKMDAGVGLLKQNNMQVTDIALHLGFSDPAAFCNAFRKKFGVPPSAFPRG